MNKTPEHYKITPDLPVIYLIDHVTQALVIQDVPSCAHVAVYYSHALKSLMNAGKKSLPKAGIAKAKAWLDMLESSSDTGDHLACAQKNFIRIVEKTAHGLATCYHLPWFYDLVAARLALLGGDDIEKKLQKISILEQKISRHDYLTTTCGLSFDEITRTYTCDCSTQFERDKAVSLLASFDVMDVTSVFQAESKTWLVMGSYKDE